MAVENPPLHLQAGSHPAVNDRRFTESVFGGRSGVIGVASLEVTEKSGTPNMSVDVAGGACVIEGDESPGSQSFYFCNNGASVNLAVAASDATNPRKDIVVAKVQDSAYSGATDAWSLDVVTGTPAATALIPTVPSNAIVLAVIDVAALATTVVDSNITDSRSVEVTDGTSTVGEKGYVSAVGGEIICTSGNRPTGVTGLRIYETDTGKSFRYNGTSYVQVSSDNDGIWQTYTPSNTNLTTSTNDGRYTRIGDTIHFSIDLVLNGTTGSGGILVGLPVIAESAVRNTYQITGRAFAHDDSANEDTMGTLKIEASGTQISIWRASAYTSNAASAWNESSNGGFSWASADRIVISGTYEV